jgi:RNA:NAD 2'-phosphotransferase (TPT1/KptA family)
MKFRNWLLEEETGKSVIMYHGTSMALWPKIKQNGLQAFPDNRSWAADPHAGFSTASRASYGGIYLTVNVITATGAAVRTLKRVEARTILMG